MDSNFLDDMIDACPLRSLCYWRVPRPGFFDGFGAASFGLRIVRGREAQDFFFFDGKPLDVFHYASCHQGEPFETDDSELLDALRCFETLLRAPHLEGCGQ